MKNKIRLLAKISGILLLGLGTAAAAESGPKKILVVTVTTGFRHSSIETAEKVLAKLGKDSGAFTVEYVRQPGSQPNPPEKPGAPTRPVEPQRDADDAKYQAALDKYQRDLEKFPAAETKFKTDLEKFTAEEPQRTAAFKVADAEWRVKLTNQLARLAPESLKNFDAVIFANTTGDLPLPDNDAFINWVKEGHAFIAMHSGSDTFHGYRPYVEMLGGEFEIHHAQVAIDAINQDRDHPACRHLDPTWQIFDEIYLFQNFKRSAVHGLLTIPHHPNDKTKAGDYPVAWCKEFGQGRVFYTSLGHREDVWENPIYQVHVLNGIKWALGLMPGGGKPQLTY